MFKKIGLIALALTFSASLAFAESGYRKPHRKPHYNGNVGGHYHGGNKNRYNGGHNRYYGGNNNRYYGGHNNNYYFYRGGNNGNKYFYNDPYFWGGVAGSLIGGAIIRDYYVEPECETVWVRIYVPGKGYRNEQRVVCD